MRSHLLARPELSNAYRYCQILPDPSRATRNPPLPYTRQSRVGSCETYQRDGGTMPKNEAHPTDTHVGKRVRMRRMMLGMSQEMLGDALDLTFQQVQKYEKGTNRVSASRLQHISQILQVPVALFFEGAPRVRGASCTNRRSLPAIRIRLSRNVGWAPAHQSIHAD